LVLHGARPKGDHVSTPTIVSSVTQAVVLLGMAIYLVRIFGQRYRAHRHLEVVCNQKADALDTFSEMVRSAQPREVQAQIALTLAGYVFSSEGTGYLDDDGVTLIERIVERMPQRS
jgi:hypothetical protein